MPNSRRVRDLESRIEKCEAAIQIFAMIQEELRQLGAPADGRSRVLNRETTVALNRSLDHYRAVLEIARHERR